jgi:hypothetical protein
MLAKKHVVAYGRVHDSTSSPSIQSSETPCGVSLSMHSHTTEHGSKCCVHLRMQYVFLFVF